MIIMQHPSDADDAISLMLSIELAKQFNPHKDVNRVVKKVCTHARHRMRGNMKEIANYWRTIDKPHDNYVQMMGSYIV